MPCERVDDWQILKTRRHKRPLLRVFRSLVCSCRLIARICPRDRRNHESSNRMKTEGDVVSCLYEFSFPRLTALE